MQFDHVVSLGANCRGAWNLRRHFNFGEAYPFDWWITPPAGLLRLLTNFDLDYLYDPALLIEQRKPDGVIDAIRHAELGIVLRHEFPREWDQRRHVVTTRWREHLDRPRQRTEYLLNRFLALNERGKRILFVRNSRSLKRDSVVPEQLLSKLRDMFPEASLQLLLINNVVQCVTPMVTSLEFVDECPNWKGDWPSWHGALARTGFQLVNPGSKPFDPKARPEGRVEAR